MIQVDQLTQIYKSGKGIFDLTFEIKEGEVFGYLGPNGAGKTTTIRNLLGFANATKGHAKIADLDCRKDAAKLQEMIGYLPGEIAFFNNMSGMEFLKFMGEMRRMKDITRRDQLIERFELDPKGKIKKMSKGMKQKIGIIAAFMHDPKVYILDEPTSGLDPLMQSVFMTLIDEEKERGKTIMMSSHIFEEVQRSCDRVGIIREGHLVAIEDIKSIHAMKQKDFIVSVASETDVDKLMASKLNVSKLGDKKVLVKVSGDYEWVLKTLVNCQVKDLDIKHQTLEDLFMKYYGKVGASHE